MVIKSNYGMNNKLLFAIVAGVVLIGGALYFTSGTTPRLVAQESAVVDLKNGDTYDLTARYVTKEIGGKTQMMLAYNGMIPGPTIKVQQGAEVTVNFKNLTNQPTLLHSHGVRMGNAFDGSQLQQKDIPPGGSFSYKLKFPDAGVFWYHPHLSEVSQQPLGLYGNYIVTPTDQNYWPPVNEEIPLMMGDILVDSNGSIAAFSNPSDHALMGRFGNVMLTNGSDNYALTVKQGEVVQFDITNVANTRVFNLSIPGAKMKLVGADNGHYEHEQFVDSVMLAPSERAIIDVLFDKPGTYTITHATPDRNYTMGTVTVSNDMIAQSYKSQFLALRSNTDIEKAVPNLNSYFSKPDDKSLSLTVDLGSMGMSGGHMMSNGQMMMNGGSHMMPDGTMMSNGGMDIGGSDNTKIEWEDSMAMMNRMSTVNNIKWKIVDQDTRKSGEDINWTFKKDDLVKIKIYNDPTSSHPMQHPIHFHGQRFIVLTTNGVKNDDLVWKDTTLVQKGDTVEILVDMSNPGTWMAHCHISEHLESGMMFKYTVE